MTDIRHEHGQTPREVGAVTREHARERLAARLGQVALVLQGGSEIAIGERIATGYRDAKAMLEDEPWLDPVPPDIGVAIHELPDRRAARTAS